MPQIDTVTYLPIVLWSLVLFLLGYILFNLFGLLWLCNMRKIGTQWINYQLRAYWLGWNHEKTADDLAWSYPTASALPLDQHQQLFTNITSTKKMKKRDNLLKRNHMWKKTSLIRSLFTEKQPITNLNINTNASFAGKNATVKTNSLFSSIINTFKRDPFYLFILIIKYPCFLLLVWPFCLLWPDWALLTWYMSKNEQFLFRKLRTLKIFSFKISNAILFFFWTGIL